MNFPIALSYTFLLGFLSVGMQQAWSTAFSFSIGGDIVGFSVLGFVLALLGLGLGGFWGYRYCKAHRLDLIRFVVKASFLACVFSYILMPLYSNLLVLVPLLGFVFWVPVYVIIFGAVGTIPPILIHAVKRQPWQSVGRSAGWLLASFLFGGFLAPWLVGLIFLDKMHPEKIIRIAAIGFGVLPVFLVTLIDYRKASQKKGLIKLGGLTVVLLVLLAFMDGQTSQKLFYKNIFNPQRDFSQAFKSAEGLLASVPEQNGADSLYRHGAYRGRLSFDPTNAANRIDRAYYISSLHPDPVDVLQIGLGNGAWASVLAGNPATSSLTVIDAHPHTRKLIDRYSEIKPILHDNKVKIIAGDGRRWLLKKPRKKFDLIVLNNPNTHDDHLTRLLSDDFIQLAKRHLKEGGMLTLNSTGCTSVFKTMADAFPYMVTVDGTAVGAFSTLQGDDDIVRKRLEGFRPNGNVVFDSMDAKTRDVLEEISKYPKSNEREFYLKVSTTMTDNNLWCEYKEHVYVRQINEIKDKILKLVLGD